MCKASGEGEGNVTAFKVVEINCGKLRMDLLCVLNHRKKCVGRYSRVSRLIYSSSSRVSIKVKSGWINLLRSLSSWFLKISTGSHFHFSGQLADVRSLLLWRIAFPQLWSEFFLLQCVIIGSWPSTVHLRSVCLHLLHELLFTCERCNYIPPQFSLLWAAQPRFPQPLFSCVPVAFPS